MKFLSMPFIIAQELLQIWKQLFGGLQQEFWHAVIADDDFACNLQAATNLTEEEYNTLLLSSGILFKRGGVSMFNKSHLDYLQAALKEKIILSNIHSQLQKKGKNTFFIAVRRPRYTNPSAQAKANKRQLPKCYGYGLDEKSTPLPEQLYSQIMVYYRFDRKSGNYPRSRHPMNDRFCQERNSHEEPRLVVDDCLT